MDLPVNQLEFGPFLLDPRQRLLLRDGKPVPLSPKAFELLLVLVQRSGQVVLKDDLMNLLWPDTFVEESNLGQHVFQLRKALGDPSYIVTIPGRGYQLASSVRAIPATESQEPAAENARPSQIAVEDDVRMRPPAPAPRFRRRLLVVVLGAVVVIGAVAAMTIRLSPSPRVLRVRQITHSGRIEPYGKVLSDGSRLYFTERRGGTEMLAQVAASGGEPASILTSIPSMIVYDIDPDKARLLVGSHGPNFDQPLWIVPTSGGSARRVGDIFASTGTVWSPDGENIFYGHDAQLYKVSDSGDEPEKLLTAPGYLISLRVSPDGKLLRFTVRDSSTGVISIWESSVEGQELHPLALGWKGAVRHWGDGESCGDWSPDGRYFVLRAEHEGMESFWLLREKRGWLGNATPVQLYTTPDHLGEPRFSADGKTLFFTNYQERRELVRYDSAQKLFVPYLGGIPVRLLSFSKDGQWVSYRNETDGSLWRSRTDGTEKFQLTFPPMEAYHSTWSPDGKAIVFGGRFPGQPSRLYRVPWDGGKPEALTGASGVDGEPSWSPDGQSIIFERWTANETGTRHSAVYILELNTRETRMLAGTENFDGVHWSPDGKYATASDEAGKRLMLFEFAQQRWSELAAGVPYGWGLRWSSDSRYVYYQHIDEGEEQPLFRVSVGDRRVERITSARQILRSDILSYSMTGLTPDNSPLVSLVRRNSDVYALELELP